MASVSSSMYAATKGITTQSFGVVDFMPGDSVPWAKRTKAKRQSVSSGKIQTQIIKQSFGFR